MDLNWGYEEELNSMVAKGRGNGVKGKGKGKGARTCYNRLGERANTRTLTLDLAMAIRGCAKRVGR